MGVSVACTQERYAVRTVPRRRSRLFLFQLALGLLGKVKMLLNHLGSVVRKLFHVGITAAFCFFLELGEVLFVILDHRIHVSFIRSPAYGWLFRRQFCLLLRRNLFQLIVGLTVIGDHSFAE